VIAASLISWARYLSAPSDALAGLPPAITAPGITQLAVAEKKCLSVYPSSTREGKVGRVTMFDERFELIV
jgi:hypothetical protein